jgi:hypothetical protein
MKTIENKIKVDKPSEKQMSDLYKEVNQMK